METIRAPWPGFRVIQGGLQRSIDFSGIHIVASPKESPPFAVEAMAVEEDTFLVMGTDPLDADELVHPLRLMAELADFVPETPGTVRIRETRPLQLQAIVHDIDNVPTWREEWVKQAISKIFEIIEQRGIKSLGLPLIGTQYGTMETRVCAKIIGSVLSTRHPGCLKKIWMITPVPVNAETIRTISAFITAA